MRRYGLHIACCLIVAAPLPAWAEEPPRDDPLEAVALALDQGRHWYASRLLRNLDRSERGSPAASLLAARADGGRGAWAAVVRRLELAEWLDLTRLGEGRALLARAQLETGQNQPAIENYRIFLEYSVERLPRVLAEIGLARALNNLGDGREAAAAYVRAADLVPEIRPYAAMRAAEGLAPLGDTAAVRQLLDEAIAAPSYRRNLAMVTAYEQAGDREQALRRLLEAADAPDARYRSAELRARVATIHLEQGDTAAASGTLRTAIRLDTRRAREAAELLSELPDLRAEDHQQLGLAFERSGAPLEAAQHYALYLELSDVSSGERQKLQLKIGELLYRGGSHFAAVDQLEQLIASDTDRSRKAQAEYIAARATYRRGWRREGRARMQDVADAYPGTGAALRSLSLLGDLYESAGDTERARAIYEEVAQRYNGSKTASLARYRLGILDFLDGDYAGARKSFDRLRRASRWSDLKISTTYWAARARLAEGGADRIAEAERLFQVVHSRDPFGYYGFLSAQRAGIDPWEQLRPGPEPVPVDAETRQQFDIVRLLRSAGLAEEAQSVLETIINPIPDKPAEMLGLAQELAARGFGQDAVKLGWRAHARLRGVWSASVLQAVYPLAFRDIIAAESRAQRLDPYLVAAIARQESAFEPEVVSRAGARGLLQLMPATGRWWAGRMGIGDYRDELLFHPETNVHLGTAYFADLQRRYGELQIALIAYNAGPTRARRWRQRPEYQADAELFAERIPLSETRSYVRNVQTHYWIYRQLYGAFEPAAEAE
jgi:soluble lytic murein transglycosylase